MLISLFIQDIVLIERLTLTIGQGLTALTGETGAGKSILLDSLSLATGGRADKSMIRQGASQAIVSATFEPPHKHAVWGLLAENGIGVTPDQDPLIILRRVLGADGRARAFINDQPVSVGLLRKVGESLIEVHGQHQGQGFLQASMHRALLDEYGGLQNECDITAEKYKLLSEQRTRLADRKKETEAAAREADYLRHVADELRSLNPQIGEEETLALKRAQLMAAEKTEKDLSDVVALLSAGGTASSLSSAIARLERLADALGDAQSDAMKRLLKQLDTVLTEWNEADHLANLVAQNYTQQPDELDKIEERLFALRAAARKFNVPADALSSLRERTENTLALLEEDAELLADLEKQIWQAEKSYDQAATTLSTKRRKASAALEKAVSAELAPLKLSAAQFHAEIVTGPENRGEHGIDHVQFLISTNPGAPLGPLKQIASGGELSRFVLALKAALMAKEDRTVIIFDEVDAGVGGAVADAVGERLAKLAAQAQVLVVTHSPQVAARGQMHWRVQKNGQKKITTHVQELDAEERIEEIARMLSGASVTSAAREAARALLSASDGAAGARKRGKAG